VTLENGDDAGPRSRAAVAPTALFRRRRPRLAPPARASDAARARGASPHTYSNIPEPYI